MSQSLVILGRQPALGLAELERLYGGAALQTTNQPAVARLNLPAADVAFERLGGSVKLALFFEELPFSDWRKVVAALGKNLPSLLASVPEGKIRLESTHLNARGSEHLLLRHKRRVIFFRGSEMGDRVDVAQAAPVRGAGRGVLLLPASGRAGFSS